MRSAGTASWQASIDTPRALIVALHVRDAAGLDTPIATTGTDVVVPPLEPAVDLDARLAPYATEGAAAAWSEWWESLLVWHPELPGVNPMVSGTFPEYDVNLRSLLGLGLRPADAWFAAYKRRNLDELRIARRQPVPAVAGGIGELVREAEAEFGHAAGPFDLAVSILPVSGLWSRQVRRDHVLISRALGEYRTGFTTFLRPVIRELVHR